MHQIIKSFSICLLDAVVSEFDSGNRFFIVHQYLSIGIRKSKPRYRTTLLLDLSATINGDRNILALGRYLYR